MSNNTCANCGEGEECSDDLKACTACMMVKYCSRDCQIAHRPQHKKACKKRATELRDEKLFKESPPREECPICMLPLPVYDTHNGMTFHSCCGKRICDGCVHTIEESGAKDLCPFCRTPPARSPQEEVKRTEKLMEKGNAQAFYMLASCYAQGINGMPQDRAKVNELLLKSGELGCADAYYNLGNFYNKGDGVEIDMKKAKHYYELADLGNFYNEGDGVEIDMKKAKHYYGLAAMNGHIKARYNLGCMEGNAGDNHRAMNHFIISARAGHNLSLDNVKYGYTQGHVTKEEYANTLREYQKSQDEMTSDARDKAAVQ